MGTVKLENLLSDKPLLVATCEVLARHMNGPAMRRLRFLLEELALDASGASLYPEDREWLDAGIDKAVERHGHWQADLARLCNVGVDLTACIDDNYPLNLSLVHDGPPLLFVRGELTSCDRRAVAIVGTRSASKSGLDLAERLASGVVERDYTVIAGLAAGIDTAVTRHRPERGRSNDRGLRNGHRADLSRRESCTSRGDLSARRLRIAVPSGHRERRLGVSRSQPHNLRPVDGNGRRRGLRNLWGSSTGRSSPCARKACLSRQ